MDTAGSSPATIGAASGFEHLDGACDRRGGCEASVSGQQWAAQRLGECDIARVVRRDVRSKLERSNHERPDRISGDGKRPEIGNRILEPAIAQIAGEPPPSQDRNGLYIDEVRSRCISDRFKPSTGGTARRFVIADDVCQYRGIDNDHRRPRSSCRSSTAVARPTRPPDRSAIRASTSFIVGDCATRASSLLRYCWSDWPAASARRCKLAWMSSGRSRIRTFGMLSLCLHSTGGATLTPLDQDHRSRSEPRHIPGSRCVDGTRRSDRHRCVRYRRAWPPDDVWAVR